MHFWVPQGLSILVIPSSPYYQHDPIHLGIIHIDWALELATEEELENLD